MFLDYQVKVSIDPLGVITLDESQAMRPVDGDAVGAALERHARTMIDTRDEAIRQALIALGWRPPLHGPNVEHGNDPPEDGQAELPKR